MLHFKSIPKTHGFWNFILENKLTLTRIQNQKLIFYRLYSENNLLLNILYNNRTFHFTTRGYNIFNETHNDVKH